VFDQVFERRWCFAFHVVLLYFKVFVFCVDTDVYSLFAL